MFKRRFFAKLRVVNAASEFEERLRFLKGPGGKQLLSAIGNSVSAFHWGTPPVDVDHRNGSMFFIDTGEGIFGVTAKHVYEEYERRIAERYLLCQLDNMRFDPIARLISTGAECDIATFKICPRMFKRGSIALQRILWRRSTGRR